MLTLLLERGADPNARVNRKVWFSSYNFDQSNVDEIGASPFWRAAYASDVDAMKVLVAHGADPFISTIKGPARRGPEDPERGEDRSGLPPLPVGAPNVTPLQAAAGVGYGFGFAGNSHHVAPGGMLRAVKYLVEEAGQDVNAVDADGNTALHHAASRGDNDDDSVSGRERRGRHPRQPCRARPRSIWPTAPCSVCNRFRARSACSRTLAPAIITDACRVEEDHVKQCCSSLARARHHQPAVRRVAGVCANRAGAAQRHRHRRAGRRAARRHRHGPIAGADRCAVHRDRS